MVSASLNPCPADPEETAKAYLLANTPADKARAFEHHYTTCPECRGILRRYWSVHANPNAVVVGVLIGLVLVLLLVIVAYWQ